MFTKNYISWQKAAFINKNTSVTDISGASKNVYISHMGAVSGTAIGYHMSRPTLSRSNGLIFGTGSTPATENNYSLENQITTGLTFTSGSVNFFQVSDGKYLAKVSHILTNTSGSEINIYEIGVVGQCYLGTGSGSSTIDVLFERTVLTEPITIQPGESKLVTYEIAFNHVLTLE